MTGTISLGPGTHELPLSLFQANRQRVCDELKKSDAVDSNTFVLLQGGDTISFYDTDTDYVFRQVGFDKGFSMQITGSFETWLQQHVLRAYCFNWTKAMR